MLRAPCRPLFKHPTHPYGAEDVFFRQLMSKKGSRSLAKPLDGYCFAITGALSVSRQEFETLIQNNGGEIAKSVTKKCTHLVSAMTGTKKCQDAEAKGLQVVDEEWVREKILSSGGT
jgi:NAD-dependent DNA ligase